MPEECRGGEARVRISLRSNCIDVSAIARLFEGGRHTAAAGCQTILPEDGATPEEVLKALIELWRSIRSSSF